MTRLTTDSMIVVLDHSNIGQVLRGYDNRIHASGSSSVIFDRHLRLAVRK